MPVEAVPRQACDGGHRLVFRPSLFFSRENRIAPAGCRKREIEVKASEVGICLSASTTTANAHRRASQASPDHSITLRANRPRLSEAGNGRMGRWRLSTIGRINSAAPKPEGAKLRPIRT
jgi:hypothetical protein